MQKILIDNIEQLIHLEQHAFISEKEIMTAYIEIHINKTHYPRTTPF